MERRGINSPSRALAARVAPWGVLAVILAADLVFPRRSMPLSVFYAVALLLCVPPADRTLLWVLTGAGLLLNYAVGLWVGPPADGQMLLDRTLAGSVLIMAAFAGHLWIRQARNARALRRRNRELTMQHRPAHPPGLSTQNSLLQTMLDVSRLLTVEPARAPAMQRICRAAMQLVDGLASAAAVLERRDETMEFACHVGFGPGGPQPGRIPLARSLAARVIEQGRALYVADAAARKELQLPRRDDGSPLLAALSVPLSVCGRPAAALEVYSPHRHAWESQQIEVIEALAAQASRCLEAAELFEKLEDHGVRFEAVLRTVPLGVGVVDAGYSDLRFNPTGAAMLEVPAETNLLNLDLPGRWELLKDGQYLPILKNPLARAIAEGRRCEEQELEIVVPSGRRVAVLCSAAPFYDRQDRLLGAVCGFTDITAQKLMQRELDERRRRAEDDTATKTRFLAAASHDIRAPANAISLLAELIQRMAQNPALIHEVPEAARELHQSAVSLVNLVSDVLDLTKLDTGAIELHGSNFDLARLLNEESMRMLPLAQEKGLSFVCDPPAMSLWVHADRGKLRRVLDNLIGNAIKFTSAGLVRVDPFYDSGGPVQIRVSDSGVGISTEDCKHIFDEFFQLKHRDREHEAGSGLGLTITKRLVEAMGGTLRVDSEVGHGSTFTVMLPAECVVPAPG